MSKKHIFSDPRSPDFTFGGLRYFVDFVRARRGKVVQADSEKADKPPTMKSFATARGGESEYGNFRLRLAKIEEAVGQDLVVRKGKKWSSELTLPGEIWAEFGELVLALYGITWHATNNQEPSGKTPKKGLSHRRLPSRTDPEIGQHEILDWLKEQNATISQARQIAEDYGVSLQRIVHLTAGYQPPENSDPSDVEQ